MKSNRQINHFSSAKLHQNGAEQKKVAQLDFAVEPGNPFYVAVMQPSHLSP